MKSARSTPPPSYKRLPIEEARERILSWCSKDKPLLVGAASVKLGVGWSLQATEDLFEHLSGKGLIRRLSRDELKAYGLSDGYLLV